MCQSNIQKGKLTKTAAMILDNETTIRELEQEESYKYLGVCEGDGIQHSKMKERIRKEYYRRIRLVLKSELNALNRIEAINTLAIPVVTYSFNIINWQMSEIQRMDRKTRKLLTMERMHHPKSDVDRLYLPRDQGGRGLTQLEMTYKTTTIGLYHYLNTSKDMLMALVLKHEKNKKLYSVHKEAHKFERQLEVPEIQQHENSATEHAKKVKKLAKQKALQLIKDSWEIKPMHGQYPKGMNKPDIDAEKTHRWLKSSSLKSETEGLIIAAQDQSLATRSYHHRIIGDNTNPECRMCLEFEETVDHIISGCPTLARNEYIQRHNKAAAYIHWNICQHFQIPTTTKWYEHAPETVIENEDVSILWDMPVHTDKEIKANRPDIIVKNKKEKTCLLIDMTCPSDKNVSTKEVEKLSKYKDLEIEVTRMWGMKTTIVPVVVGALGVIKKHLDKHINKIPGQTRIEELQKIVLLGTAHIIRKTLSIQ